MTYANHATDEVSTVIVSSKKTQNRDSSSFGCHEAKNCGWPNNSKFNWPCSSQQVTEKN